MEHATFLYGVSFAKKPRRGQIEAFAITHDEVAHDPPRKSLTLKLPTGYGKTITAAGVYAILKNRGKVNRVLYVTPRIAQHDAIVDNGIYDFAVAGLTIAQPVDVSFYGIEAFKKHRRATAEVFAITIQSLAQAAGRSLVDDLLQIGEWLVVIDEHHHVGDGKAWGRTIKHLRDLPGCKFILAMSATPDRPDEDGPFGEPEVNVLYRGAAKEGDVKPLRGHSYVYRLDASGENGELFSMTTDELAKEAGGNDPDKIEKLMIDRKMRLLPKYVSPLVYHPIERLLTERTNHNQIPLQALITCMSVSHARLVYDQVRSMYPQLRIDWVGTGKYGRSDEENKRVLTLFCPPKQRNAFGEIEQKEPELDVLIHVGMAGEGLDTRMVSEIIFLCPCNLSNTTLQIIGRGSRALFSGDTAIICHVSFDSSGELAETKNDDGQVVHYVGSAIMDAMDLAPPVDDEGDGDEGDDREPGDLPDIEDIILLSIALDHIDSGDDERINRMPIDSPPLADTARALERVSGDDWWEDYLRDPELQEKVRTAYKDVVNEQHTKQDERAQITFWQSNVDSAVGKLAFKIARLRSDGKRFEKSLIYDLKKVMNQHKARACSPVRPDVELLKRHYQWCINLQTEIKERGIPQWLL